VGRPDWLTGYPRASDRAANAVDIIADLDDIFATKPLDDWAKIFATEPDLFWSPINSMEEIIGDDQFHDAGGLISVPDGDSSVPMVATPADFHGTPWAPRSVAPGVGEHTDEILAELKRDA
jgi:crotonobetainyl-CoA:carnitine CoA-transferase CaiB-like acyl-CoA transferase